MKPPVLPLDQLEDFIDDVFGNILDLRETNRRLLEVMNVRQREEGPIIQKIGDIFLEAATEFRFAYPTYIGHLPISEKRLKDEVESNAAFRLFLEVGKSCQDTITYLFSDVLNLAMCERTIAPFWRISKTRPQTFPEPSIRAPAKVSCVAGSCSQRDRSREHGYRVFAGSDPSDQESPIRSSASHIPVCYG